MSEIWNKLELLRFSSDEFGVIYRNPETGQWMQDHPLDGERNLNVDTLKEAMVKGVLPYNKKKSSKPKKKKAKPSKDKNKSSKPNSKKMAKSILKGRNVR